MSFMTQTFVLLFSFVVSLTCTFGSLLVSEDIKPNDFYFSTDVFSLVAVCTAVQVCDATKMPQELQPGK